MLWEDLLSGLLGHQRSPLALWAACPITICKISVAEQQHNRSTRSLVTWYLLSPQCDSHHTLLVTYEHPMIVQETIRVREINVA